MDFFYHESGLRLPKAVFLLPVYGSILMPRARLPIPIFEDDYLHLASDIIHEAVYVGVIQPIIDENFNSKDPLTLFTSGTLGRITDVVEVEEKRMIVNVTGVCRFDIEEEYKNENGCRKATVGYERYLQDLQELDEVDFDRVRLIEALDNYFYKHDLTPNWEEINEATDARLIAALTMVCPFNAREKQALLEVPTIELQSEMITRLIEFANFEGISPSLTRH
jgi:uncharacterized protein